MLAEIDVPQVAAWEASGRSARARDYSDEVYKLIVRACTRYEIFIATEQAFPDANQQTQKAHAFFKEACEDIGANYEVTDRITTIVSEHLLSFLLITILTYCHLDQSSWLSHSWLD